MDLALTTAQYRALLRGFFGPTPPDAKTEAESRWEDDGGPTVARCEGWKHTWALAPNPFATVAGRLEPQRG